MIKALPGHAYSAKREPQVRSKIASIILVLWSSAIAGAQPNDEEGPPTPIRQVPAAEALVAGSAEPRDGLWPSSKLVGSLLARVADEISHTYELDEDQRRQTRDLITDRWKTFLDDNRNELQPLLNEFIEMRMDLEPPDKDRVEQWAKRAAPAFDLFREQIETGASEFREVLSPRQRTQFEVERLALRVGLQVAEQKLKLWQKGQFEEREFWQPPPTERRRAEQRAAAKESAAAEERATAAESASAKEKGNEPMGVETGKIAAATTETGSAKTKTAAGKTDTATGKTESDPILQELSAWDQYVEQFILLHKFDDGQRTTARSILNELKGRALDHRERRKDDIARLENRISTFTGADNELDELKKQLTELYGPIDDMFKELTRRLHSILSPTQREKAEKR